MSCNHLDAIRAFQKARDMKALSKLLLRILYQAPVAFTKAWNSIDLGDHRCPVCKGTRLTARNTEKGLYFCEKCNSRFCIKVES